MNQKELREMRQRLLSRLNDALNNDSIAARYQQADEGAEPEGVVTVLFDSLGNNQHDAFGEIFFYPMVDSDSELQHFACIIMISEDLKEGDYAALEGKCSLRNNISPIGAFYVDEVNGRLLYRLAIPLLIGMDEDVLFAEMNAVVGNALGVVDNAIDDLLSGIS